MSSATADDVIALLCETWAFGLASHMGGTGTKPATLINWGVADHLIKLISVQSAATLTSESDSAWRVFLAVENLGERLAWKSKESY